MSIRKRGSTYHYQFQHKGTTYCGTLTAKTVPEARALESDERTKVRLGIREQKEVIDEQKEIIDDDFSKFVNDVYLKYSRENKESHVHDQFRCKALLDYFTSRRLRRFQDITVLGVVGLIKYRLATKITRYRQKSPGTKLRSPVTVHKEVTLLSSIFNMAIQEKIATENPCNRIPKAVRRMLRSRSKRSCNMTPEKEELLLKQGLIGRYAHLQPTCQFDLNTGLRWGELRRLERDHFNLGNETKYFDVAGEFHEVPRDCFIVIKSKNGKPRVIPMNARARTVAVHQLEDATVGRYVFPSIKTGEMIVEIKKGFAGACKQAGIPYGQSVAGGITFHTLRHWFSTKLEDLRASKTVRRDLLGHEPRDITDDYTHSTIEMSGKPLPFFARLRVKRRSNLS